MMIVPATIDVTTICKNTDIVRASILIWTVARNLLITQHNKFAPQNETIS